MNEGLVGSFLL